MTQTVRWSESRSEESGETQTHPAHTHPPLHVNGGYVKRHSFEPQHHEEPLGERTVPNALSITARLHTHSSSDHISQSIMFYQSEFYYH